MKVFFKIFGVVTLICFSFFYTDKVMTVVSDKDPLKIQIVNLQDEYKISPNEAIITTDTIIPGNNGKELNIEASYNKMKKNNIFNTNLLEYKEIYPEHRLIDNKDKYIINGSINKKSVSLLFLIDSNNNLNKLFDILDKKNVKVNLFIEYKYLNSNITDIKNHNNHNIYLYRDNYTYDSLIISNNIIKRISDTNPIYCLTKEKNTNNLNICSYLEMYTIIPSINGNYNEIKTKLDNGSIILFDTSSVTISELSYIIDFITGKGYNIETLDKLLQEKI